MRDTFLDLDHNATSPMAMAAVRAQVLGHRLMAMGVGTQPLLYARLMARCRRTIARSLGAHADEVWLTSGGTEANALVLASACASAQQQHRAARVVISMLEHPSLAEGVAHGAASKSIMSMVLPTGADGACRVPDEAAIKPIDLVSVMLANNETGVVQPVERVMAAFAGTGALRHADGVQALGRWPIRFAHMPLDLLTVAGHKVGAGGTMGVLLVRRGCAFLPPAALAARQDALGAWETPGGAHLPSAMALAAAVTEAQKTACATAAQAAVRDDFERQLQALCAPVTILGGTAARLPNTSCVRFINCSAETMLVALDVQGIGVSLGSACSSGVSTPSVSVRAMGLTDAAAREVLRVSWPMHASACQWAHMSARLLAALTPLCRALRS